MSVAGTPVYMAPEVFDGVRSEQTDIWSAGVIFYLLLVGRLPFPQTDTASLIGAIIRHDPEPLPPSVPRPLQEVIARALQKDPAHRYQSASQMRRALRDASQSPKFGNADQVDSKNPVHFIAEPPPPTMPPTSVMLRSGNHWLRTILGGALAVAIVALVIALIVTERTPITAPATRPAEQGGSQRTTQGGTASKQEPAAAAATGGSKGTALGSERNPYPLTYEEGYVRPPIPEGTGCWVKVPPAPGATPDPPQKGEKPWRWTKVVLAPSWAECYEISPSNDVWIQQFLPNGEAMAPMVDKPTIRQEVPRATGIAFRNENPTEVVVHLRFSYPK